MPAHNPMNTGPSIFSISIPAEIPAPRNKNDTMECQMPGATTAAGLMPAAIATSSQAAGWIPGKAQSDINPAVATAKRPDKTKSTSPMPSDGAALTLTGSSSSSSSLMAETLSGRNGRPAIR